jgi:putative oxidoreductase
MGAFLDRNRDRIYALMRIVAGYMFACHGAMKLLGPAGPMPPAMQWTAGLIELIGGTLICVGLFTRWSAFISSGTMAVAYFLVHQPMGPLPIQNDGELAALYAFVFLFIAARGSGPWSIEGDRQERA